MDWQKLREELERRIREAKLAGGEERIKKQHERGKLTARERIEALLDPNSFMELDLLVAGSGSGAGEGRKFLGEGAVAGMGKIHSRAVFVYAQDFTVLGGSLSYAQAKKICKLLDLALKVGAPFIALNDSGGARIQEGVASLAGYGEIFLHNTLASGVIPQISAIMGPCAGGAVYSPGLTDFILMVKPTSYMYITGPEVVKRSTGEEISHIELGGADVHSKISGVCDLVAEDDRHCLELIRQLLTYLPQNNQEEPPVMDSGDAPERATPELFDIIPTDPNKAYDIKKVINVIFDQESFFELKPDFAPNMVIGFARLGGYVVGVVANQPAVQAGVIDSRSARKSARFVRFCDAFNIPIITLVDVPGFMPGSAEEQEGIIHHGAKLIFAYAEATVPKITLILRKAYGGAYIVMGSKHLRADLNFALPSAEVAVMGPESAISVIYRKEIKETKEPDKLRQKLIDEYREKFANPYLPAELGYIDEVLSPELVRSRLYRGLEFLLEKIDRTPRKKHPNPPL